MVTCEDRVEKNKKFKVGDIHKQVKAPAAKPDDLSLKPKPIWWEKRIVSHQLLLNLHMCAMEYANTHTLILIMFYK